MKLEKTLQKKFIVTAMAAITILILALLGGLNAVNLFSVKSNIRSTLNMVADYEAGENGQQFVPAEVPEAMQSTQENESATTEEEENPEPPEAEAGFNPRDDDDRMLASTLFVVKYDEDGNITSTDVSRIASVDEEEAQAIAEEVREEEAGKVGRYGKYRYTIRENKVTSGTTVVFLDTSDEMYAGVRVLVFSIGVGVLGWLAMLILVTVMSRRAIRPIAANIERQKEFVTNAGHEIKTPLAIIQANTEALELYQGESKWTKNIKQQIKRMDGLTKNLLYLARMDESRMDQKTTKEDVNFTRVIESSAEDFSALMKKKKLELNLDLEKDIHIQADREQATQLVYILLDNACKYAMKGSSLEWKLVHKDKKVILLTKNRCEKLPEVPADKLFDRFYRADEARTQKAGGYGIGLSVAKGIMDVHEGTIEVKYALPDEIEFISTFPVKE